MENSLQESGVSVIVPMYNASKFIMSTIQSILNQSYDNLEIIVIDDASTDGCGEMVEKLAAENSKIVYHKMEKNSGVAVARNMAIEMARGRYIAFIDSDDLWYEKKLEKQIKLLDEKQGCFCYTAIEMIDEEGNILKEKRKVKDVVDYNYLLKNTIISTSSVLLDIQKLGKFEMPNRRRGQDYATWLMILRKGVCAYGIDEALVKYRRVENSLSSKKARNIEDVWDVQRNYEGIGFFATCYHCFCYAVNAVKKYYC